MQVPGFCELWWNSLQKACCCARQAAPRAALGYVPCCRRVPQVPRWLCKGDLVVHPPAGTVCLKGRVPWGVVPWNNWSDGIAWVRERLSCCMGGNCWGVASFALGTGALALLGGAGRSSLLLCTHSQAKWCSWYREEGQMFVDRERHKRSKDRWL